MAAIHPNKATITENGMIALPEDIRQVAGLEAGDELIMVWAPPDTILIRKISEVAADDEMFGMVMREFDQALQSAGYETGEDVLKLTREIKAEQINEWHQG